MSFSDQIRKLNRRRIDAMRGLVLRLNRMLFDKTCLASEQLCSEHILVFRLDDKLGDSVAATGFLRELKQNTKAQITVLSGGASVDVYKNLSYVDHVIVAKKGLLGTLKVFFSLKKYNFLALVNTSHLLSARIIFLFRFLKAAKKIGMLNTDTKVFSEHAIYNRQSDSVVNRYKAILKLFEIRTDHLEYDFYISEQSRKKAQSWFQQNNFSGPKIVVNAFAAARMRSLNQQTLQAIFTASPVEYNWIFIGAADQIETLKNWFSDSKYKIFYFDIATSVEESAACVQLADVVITPDTAWVHIACALKKKLVAIYRADLLEAKEYNAQIWQPYKTESTVVLARNDGSEDPDINLVDPKQIAIAVSNYLK